jgi:GNAT superfamily N-acetyltransferase
MTVRPATVADIEACVALVRQLFALEADFEFDADRVRRGLTLLMGSGDDRIVLVVDCEGAVVAMVTLQIVVSTAEGGLSVWLEDLVVDAAVRRAGLGALLLSAAEQWALSRGAHRLQLVADAGNLPALAFYAKRGWSTTRLVVRRQHLEPG